MSRKRRRHLLNEKRKRRQLEDIADQSPAEIDNIDAHAVSECHHDTTVQLDASPPKKQRIPYPVKDETLHHFLKPLNRLSEKEKDEPQLPYSFIDEAFCIEARVTVKPEVSVGGPTIECLEAEILPASHQPSTSEECTMLISQIVRVTIPVRFSARAEGEAGEVRLAHAEEDAASDSAL